MSQLTSRSHSYGEANYHIQFTVAYRRPVFVDELLQVLARDYLLAAARRHGIEVAAIGFGTDHVHLFVVRCKNHSASQIANYLKGASSRWLRERHRALFADQLWGRKFWSGGYFYRTVGAVNAATVERYVAEEQRHHWPEAAGPKQSTLIEFAVSS